MSAFATLPFEEQLAAIDAAVRDADATALLHEAGGLTDPEPLDPLSGNAVLNGIPVEIEAAGPPA